MIIRDGSGRGGPGREAGLGRERTQGRPGQEGFGPAGKSKPGNQDGPGDEVTDDSLKILYLPGKSKPGRAGCILGWALPG